MKMKLLLLSSLLSASLFASSIPDLKMPNNGLSFNLIKDYRSYNVVATHFRTDKNEIRYILANDLAYEALKKGTKKMPEGSKVVKIGWSVKKMLLYPDALEADKIQRVEYMIKDSKKFNHNGDNWGYARFVKTEKGYKSFDQGTQGCISCHSVTKSNDFLFTKYQKRF